MSRFVSWLAQLPPGGSPLALIVAITGFILFVIGLTDRSRAMLPSVLAYGAWDGMVATGYDTSSSGEAIPACTDGACPDRIGGRCVQWHFGPSGVLRVRSWLPRRCSRVGRRGS